MNTAEALGLRGDCVGITWGLRGDFMLSSQNIHAA